MERRILLHVSAHDGPLAQRVLQSAGVDAVVCETARDVAAELGRGAGALLVAEEALGDVLLAELSRYLAAQPPWSDLPVLVMAKRGADSLEAHRAVERLGNVTMLERPVRTLSLITAAR